MTDNGIPFWSVSTCLLASDLLEPLMAGEPESYSFFGSDFYWHPVYSTYRIPSRTVLYRTMGCPIVSGGFSGDGILFTSFQTWSGIRLMVERRFFFFILWARVMRQVLKARHMQNQSFLLNSCPTLPAFNLLVDSLRNDHYQDSCCNPCQYLN